MSSTNTLDINDVDHQSATVAEEIRQFETFLENEPDRLLEEKLKQKTSMPAPDDLEQRQRDKVFLAELTSKGELTNQARRKTTNTFLLILLALATLSVLAWIYSALQNYGVLS